MYCTLDDLIARYGEQELIELSDRTLPPSAIDANVVERAIADACALIDSYIGQRYALPLAGCVGPPHDPDARVMPTQLKRWACDAARYYLYDDLAPEAEVHRRMQAVKAELQALVDGKTTLVCPYGGEPGQPLASTPLAGGEVRYQFAPRAFDAEGLRGYAA